MSSITWIIIILIVISILVTVLEVTLRFAMLEKSKNDEKKWKDGQGMLGDVKWAHGDKGAVTLVPPPSPAVGEMSDLEILARELGIDGSASLEDVRRGISALKERNVVGPESEDLR